MLFAFEQEIDDLFKVAVVKAQAYFCARVTLSTVIDLSEFNGHVWRITLVMTQSRECLDSGELITRFLAQLFLIKKGVDQDLIH